MDVNLPVWMIVVAGVPRLVLPHVAVIALQLALPFVRANLNKKKVLAVVVLVRGLVLAVVKEVPPV